MDRAKGTSGIRNATSLEVLISLTEIERMGGGEKILLCFAQNCISSRATQKKISLPFAVILSNPFAKSAIVGREEGSIYFQFMKLL